MIGYCGLIPRVDGPLDGPLDEPELAFELRRAAHGRAYETEAPRAVVEWADRAGYRRVWADVWDWNVASRRVLNKLGFREMHRDRKGEGDGQGEGQSEGEGKGESKGESDCGRKCEGERDRDRDREGDLAKGCNLRTVRESFAVSRS